MASLVSNRSPSGVPPLEVVIRFDLQPLIEQFDRAIRELQEMGQQIVGAFEEIEGLFDWEPPWSAADSDEWLRVAAAAAHRHRWRLLWWGGRRAWRAHGRELGVR